ncbi:MAG TPA: hypothetical protein PLG56_10685 [Lacunisphaera sp.]|jgi:hypothetical protein|nr:hypothetical protein [Lacunisphaera sp.]
MSRQLPPCPHLPPAPPRMDASVLTAHGNERDAEFYLTALTYAQYLWQRGLAARAILKLDRALLSDVRGHEAELRQWPLPYEAMAWLLRHAPPDVFIGNPRVHFQHLADRMNEPRREQRRWRTWACWALCRAVRPEFPADPKHAVAEPSLALIAEKLTAHGMPGEADLWKDAQQRAAR